VFLTEFQVAGAHFQFLILGYDARPLYESLILDAFNSSF